MQEMRENKELSTDPFLKSFSLGTLWRLLRYPVLALSVIIIPGMMGPETYGKFAVFMSIYVICEALTELGVVQVFGRFIPEFPEHEQQNLSQFLQGMLLYCLIITLVIIGLAGVALLFFHPSFFSPAWLLVLCLVMFFGKLQGTLFAFIYGRNEIGRFSARDLMRTLFRFIFVILFFKFFGLEGALWALVINELILLGVGIYWTKDYLFQKIASLKFSYFKPYILFGLTFFVPTFLLGILRGSGNVFINILTHSTVQVSYFDIANQFLQLTGTFLTLILAALVPVLTRFYIQGQQEKVQEWLGIALAYCGIGAFIIYNLLVFLGKHVILLVLNTSFLEVYPNAVILEISIIPMLIGGIGFNLSLIKKEPRVFLISVLIGVLAMIALFGLLIPCMGAIGASWATVLGYSAYALVFYINYRKEMTAIIKRFLVVIAVFCVLAVFYSLNVDLAISIVLCIGTSVIGVFVLLLLKVVSIKHLKILWRAFKAHPAP